MTTTVVALRDDRIDATGRYPFGVADVANDGENFHAQCVGLLHDRSRVTEPTREH